MTCKGYERKLSWTLFSYCLEIGMQGLMKISKAAFAIVSVPADIRTRQFQNL
jgi:hypothetical protein